MTYNHLKVKLQIAYLSRNVNHNYAENVLIRSIFLVYDLAKMELEIDVRRKVENKDKYNNDVYSVGLLHFCFTRGTNMIK